MSHKRTSVGGMPTEVLIAMRYWLLDLDVAIISDILRVALEEM
jgi:hypothetical protein